MKEKGGEGRGGEGVGAYKNIRDGFAASPDVILFHMAADASSFCTLGLEIQYTW